MEMICILTFFIHPAYGSCIGSESRPTGVAKDGRIVNNSTASTHHSDLCSE